MPEKANQKSGGRVPRNATGISRAEIGQMIETRLRRVLKSLDALRHNVCRDAGIGGTLEEPPIPVRLEGSKKYREESSRQRLAGTVPLSLFNTFGADRQARGKNISQMLEFILHNFYKDHPPKR
ncbi:MAG: hypothetical protein WBG50_02235 [Desulfomonilaceae bacterium]